MRNSHFHILFSRARNLIVGMASCHVPKRMDPTILQFYSILESIEEFLLETPANRTILEAIVLLKSTGEKESVLKVLRKEWLKLFLAKENHFSQVELWITGSGPTNFLKFSSLPTYLSMANGSRTLFCFKFALTRDAATQTTTKRD